MDIQGACNLCNLSFRSIDLSPTVHKTRNDHGSLIKINVGQYKKWTEDCGLVIKYRLGIKRGLENMDWVKKMELV